MTATVTLPDIEHGTTDDGRPALLLRVGPDRWPVLIAPDDYDHITATTGFGLWGIQGRHVVVGDADPTAGRPAVARLLTGIQGKPGLVPAFRDGNPLNLMRSNLGIRSPVSGKTWWLVLRAGETDPAYDTRGFPCRVPAAVLCHRPLSPEPRPIAVPWPRRPNPVRMVRTLAAP